MADSVRRKTSQPPAKGDVWLRGPRSLCLKRSEYGFGFTLRHFIVYPPESYAVWEGLGSPRSVDPALPMDTIFVKQVHADSPASRAGLHTGDRIVGVDGQNVAGFPYGHVVQLIQHSDVYLRLAVVPKEHDLLQLYFGATAHNPETNQRPRQRSPEKQPSALPVPVHRLHRQLDNTPQLAKVIKHRSLDNTPRPRLSLTGPAGSSNGSATPRYRQNGRRASEGNPLKREAIYGSYCDNERLVWDEERGITRQETPRREDMVVSRGGGFPKTLGRTVGTPTDSDISDSSSSLYYQSGSSVDTSRRQSTASLPCRDGLADSKDSLSSFDSTSTLTGQDQSSDDSLIMDRIRRSCEQKDEFLRRPNQPIHYNLGAESLAAVPPIREFYARPQKLQKSTWPPDNPAPRGGGGQTRGGGAENKPVNRNVRRVRSELDSDRDSTRCSDRATCEPTDNAPRGQFVYGGQVTNVPNSNLNQLAQDAFRPSATNTAGPTTPHRQSQRHFVTTLPRIHENLPDGSPSPVYSDETSSLPSPEQLGRSLSSPTDRRYGPHTEQVQIVSLRAKQFETGRLEEDDRTDFYRSELSRLSAKKSVPTVALRTREFESRAGGRVDGHRQRESRSLDGPGPPSLFVGGNRVTLVGTKNLHCEPPRDYRYVSQDRGSPSDGPCSRARSNSAESWAAAFGSPRNASNVRGVVEWPMDRSDCKDDDEPQRHKAVRQDSYLAACRTPTSSVESRASRLLKRQGTALDESLEDLPPPSPSVEDAPPPVPSSDRPVRPTLLALPTSSADPTGREGAVSHTDVESLVSALDRAAAEGLATNGDSSVPVVIRRQKSNHQQTEEDRLRRASYLKATCGDRMHVDSDHEYSDTEQQLRSANRKWRPPLFPDDIQQLREIFEEGARPVASRQSQRERPTQVATPTQDDKENQPAAREGFLHCKITVIDGKRAGDRSWKQMWAVLTDHTLTLYKDRRDSQQASQTPVGAGESESVDVCCAQVDKAGDYTKRKHVLRMNTLSCSELLLQAADNEDMGGWLNILTLAAKEDCTSVKSPPGSARLSPLPNKGIRKLTSFRTRSPTGQSPANKALKPSAEAVAGSPKSKTWKGRVARQFRRIQHGANSPSSPTVDSYPEGSTVGIPLQHCPMSEENECVPFLVAKCTAIVEERGLDIIGIYRVPGNTAAISSLTEAVNKGFQFINFQDPRWCDVNVISSLLKLFFRKLPDALLTSELYPLFIDADKMEDPNNRITTLRKLIHELPDYHYETLKYLLTHLKRVVQHSSTNKMEARNLAIVFGPTLVRTADNNMVTMVTDMSHQCRIVESLLLYSDWFFSEEDESNGFPFDLSTDATAELEASAINHNQNLLLSNIQKVEGMRTDSSGKDIIAKVIGSSIISAANRKIQKTKTRRSNAGGEERRDDAERRRKEAAGGGSAVASSIVESVRLTEDIVKNLQAENQEDSQESPAPEGGPQPGEAESLRQQQQRLQRRGLQLPLGFEDGTIRTYAGLSATTQERIRRFEQETKAMLQRDLTRQRDVHLQADKMVDNQPDLSKKVGDAGHEPASLVSESRSRTTFSTTETSRVSSSTAGGRTTTEQEPASPHIHTNPIGDARTEAAVHRIGKKHLFSGNTDGGDAVSHATVDSLAALYGDRTDKKAEGGLRRGSSAENLAQAVEAAQKTANGTLKRFKTGKEQLAQPSQLMSSLRCGSLDSLQEVFGADRPPSDVSDDGSDLLSSLTNTFDRKLKSLLTATPPPVPEDVPTPAAPAEPEEEDGGGDVVGPREVVASPPRSRIPTYRDPSLHRRVSLTRPQATQEEAPPRGDQQPSVDKQAVRRQWLDLPEAPPKTDDDTPSKNERALSANTNRQPEPAEKKECARLKRSESLKKRDEDGSGTGVKLRRAASLTKADARPRRTESLTKTEKTESNVCKRRQAEATKRSAKEKENVATAKLKRKNGMPERAIKRRHTVGGTKDFDKAGWLDNRLREQESEESEGTDEAQKLRTSSPDLGSCRSASKGREGFLVTISLLGATRRPHSLADANLAFSALESHV